MTVHRLRAQVLSREICRQASDLGIRAGSTALWGGYYPYMCSSGSGDASWGSCSRRWTGSPPTTSSCWSGRASRPNGAGWCGAQPARRRAGPRGPRARAIQAPEHDGLKTMRSWLRAHTRLSAGGRRGWSAPAGRWRPAGRRGRVRRREITAEQVEVIAQITAPNTWPGRGAQGIDLAAVEADVRDDRRAPGPTHSCAAVVHTTWPGSTPTAPNPTPPRTGRSSWCRHPDGSRSPARFDLDEVGGEKVLPPWRRSPRPAGCAGDTRTARPALRRRPRPARDNALASGQLPTLRTVKPHVVVTIAHRTTSPTPRPAPAPPPPASAPRSPPPGPAGWPATATSPGSCSAPTGCPPTSAATSGSSPLTSAGLEARDRGCVFAGCEAPHCCATSTTCSNGSTTARPHWTTRAALRTAPHQGPPRLPHRATTRRPMAHLPPRRHRDRPPSRLARRLNATSPRLLVVRGQNGDAQVWA